MSLFGNKIEKVWVDEWEAPKVKFDPFDYINSINGPKKNLMRGEYEEEAEKAYPSWFVNTALSQYPDTILHVNAVNMYPGLDNRAQYEFLLNSIRPKKRRGKWIKKTEIDNLDLICEHYQVNRNIGRDYLSLLSEEQIQEIRDCYDQGGTK